MTAAHPRRLPRRAVGPLCCLLAVLLLTPPPAARAEGRIEGAVLHGQDGEPVADLEVVLTRLADDGEAALATARTDEDGRFAFDDVDTDHELQVATTYDGATYRSPAPTAADGEPTPVEIAVFDGTDAADEVVIASWVVWVDQHHGVAVQHDLQVENRGELTYLGEAPDGNGVRAVIAVPLAAEATGLRFLGRFTQCCATMRGTDYVHTSALPPGPAAGTLRYTVATLDALTLPAALPVESFTMMVPRGVTVASDELTLSGEIESQGNTYDVYTTDGLDRGEVLEVGFRGLAVRDTPTWLLVAAALAALALAGVAGGWLRRRRARAHRPARSQAPADPPSTTTERRTPAGTTLSPDLLVEELALLDVGFERGLLAREVYEPLRAARKAELLERPPREGGETWN
jgi:hypothetical protein